jgi:L-serine dehydratase
MNVSTFDLFKVGIGPSSSHTVGPMIAASRFATRMRERGVLEQVRTLRIELYGSLGATGKGHGTDKAVLLGLEGNLPDTVDPDYVEQRLVHIRTARSLDLAGVHRIDFDEKTQLAFLRREVLPLHPNGMRFTASTSGARSSSRRTTRSAAALSSTTRANV